MKPWLKTLKIVDKDGETMIIDIVLPAEKVLLLHMHNIENRYCTDFNRKNRYCTVQINNI